MNINTNQNRQMYVMKSDSKYQASALDKVGDVMVAVKDGELYFTYKGVDTVLRSDRIQLRNFDGGKVIAAADMVTPLKKVKIELASGINSGNPVTGKDYELIIHLPGFYTDSAIEDYYKYGIVHVTAAMEADKKEFYKAMVASLNANFSREVGATVTSNPYLEFSAGTSGSEDGIYITAKEPVWTLGIEQQRPIDFEALPQEIFISGDDVIWGTVTPVASTMTVGTDALGNGKKIADLEYFCMGERGDQYRMMGWPNVIETKYLVDPSAQYHVLELHYAFTDTGVNSYRSEKDITIVSPTQAEMIALVKAIQTAANVTIAKSTTATTWTWT